MKKIVILTILIGAIALLSTGFHGVTAQEWPVGEITMVVPFSPGGTVDRLARPFAPILEEYLGVSVNVENVPGGGTVVGTQEVLHRDLGTAFLFGSQPHLSGAIIRTELFSLNDFDFLTVTQDAPAAIIVKREGPYETFEDLIDDMIERPRYIRGAAIPGTLGHIIIETLPSFLGVDANFVPYDGGAGTRAAVLGGHVEYTVTDPEGTRVAAPELESIALTTPHASFPDVPLINDVLADMGIEGSIEPASFVRYIAAPKEFKETYPEGWEILLAAIEKTIKDPRYQEWSKESGIHIEWVEPEDALRRVEVVHSVMLENREFID